MNGCTANDSALLVLVEVVSDTVCPWCYVASKRFAKAQALLKQSGNDLRYEIVYKPYSLDPALPMDGTSKLENYREKFGAKRDIIFGNANKAGLEEGLVFDWGGEIANTFHSHRLVHNTYRVYGNAKHLELVFRLYKFYFEQNGNIGNFESLANCAADVGLDRAKTLAFLNSDEDSEETMAGLNASKNIKGIPHYKFTVAGHSTVITGSQTLFLYAEVVEDLVDAARTKPRTTSFSSSTPDQSSVSSP